LRRSEQCASRRGERQHGLYSIDTKLLFYNQLSALSNVNSEHCHGCRAARLLEAISTVWGRSRAVARRAVIVHNAVRKTDWTPDSGWYNQ
jgi:neutral trehalase